MTENDWVTLETFNWLQQAQVVQGALEGAGIPCHVPEAHLASINPMMTGMQVRVQVEASRLGDAREALKEMQVGAAGEEVNDADAEVVCPKCGSHRIVAKSSSGKNSFAMLMGLIGGVPIRRAREIRSCGDCGHSLN